MKLSQSTLTILKNFATINSNFVVTEGSVIRTISEAKNILAQATIPEAFTQNFGIYDLNEFLSVFSLIEDPDLVFTPDSVLIKDAQTKGSDTTTIKYRFANSDILTYPKSKSITMPNPDLELELSADTLNKLRKAAAVLGHQTLLIQGDKGKITLSICDSKDPSANIYSIALDKVSACQNTFAFQFLISNLKLISGDYQVKLSSKLISEWKLKSSELIYWLALEKSSTFDI
jgi:hypothetical protein